VSATDLTGDQTFSAADLDRSIPFDPRRRLRGDVAPLLDDLGAAIRSFEERKRARRGGDHERFENTLEALLANIIVAAFNRVDRHRFVAVPFNFNEYVGSDLSPTAMTLLRDVLVTAGLIEGQKGYRRQASHALDSAHARRTRLRASAKLLELFGAHGVGRSSVGWAASRDTIAIKAPDEGLGEEPSEVARSRSVITQTSRVIAQLELGLPDDSWERISSRYQAASDVEMERERAYAGDLTATFLYRAFKGGWDRGGRIYGGWWINLPKLERKHLTINGMGVVELDYGRLHPTLLFARAGIELNFDPYLVPGVEGRAVRELGKRTFNRLVNRTPRAGRKDIRLIAMPEDRAQLPSGMSFQHYLRLLVERLSPVAQWFGSGEGLKLQREDSDLAVEVLRHFNTHGLFVLPVHDSFIVPAKHEDILRNVMLKVFYDRYGFCPVIRPARNEDGP